MIFTSTPAGSGLGCAGGTNPLDRMLTMDQPLWDGVGPRPARSVAAENGGRVTVPCDGERGTG